MRRVGRVIFFIGVAAWSALLVELWVFGVADADLGALWHLTATTLVLGAFLRESL